MLLSFKTERSLFGGTGRKWGEGWERLQLRNRVIHALRLAPRGAVPRDSPLLQKMSVSLEVEWYARDVHPWDRDLPAERRAELFTAGVMTDTVVAVRQMFECLAEMDVLQVRVLEPNEPHRPVLAGTVSRDDLNAFAKSASPTMNLKLLGIHSCAVDAG
jgi:hypothetical protein